MELDAITFSKIKESGAFAVVSFTIIEAAQNPAIQQVITDEGHMTCEMVKTQGVWRCQKLTINFYDLSKSSSGQTGSILAASTNLAPYIKNSIEKTKGISVGRYTFE